MADKVIHFFSPKEIVEFISLSKSLLKKGGRFYVTVASPYSKRYQNVRGEYTSRQQEGEEFPGYFLDIMSRIETSDHTKKNYPQYKVPDAMVLFSEDDLRKLFERHKMKVVQSCSLKIPTRENPEWVECKGDESNVVGLIAQVD